MAKKEEKAKEEFDLEKALAEYPKPEWYKRAFMVTMKTDDIKSKSDLDKAMKKYGEMK